jgi:sugar O-acyltransferase (sialic acid O-acetyltransferase NeuD family)
MRRLWIVGSGGAALEVWAVHQAIRQDHHEFPDLAGFITITPPDFDHEALQVRGESDFLENANPREDFIILAVGSPGLRQQLAIRFEAKGFRSLTLIHPKAVIGPRVVLGAGCVVMAGAVLEIEINVGNYCLFNVQSSIAHQGKIGHFCNLGPGVHLAGKVRVGDFSDLGVGCSIRPNIQLGTHVIVGAGAVVVKDFPGPGILAGVPAKPLHSNL